MNHLRTIRLWGVLVLLTTLSGTALGIQRVIPTSDDKLVYSPFNWYRAASFAQSANPGAYLKFGFSGTSVGVDVDVSPLTGVPAAQYPMVRYSVDGKPATTVQLTPATRLIQCATGLPKGSHSLMLQYIAGYVFLDFWTPVNVLKVTGISLDSGASTIEPFGPIARRPLNALFLGDSITNGDDDVAAFSHGITNEVDTQDATLGYPAVVSSGIDAEFGVVAYGGASWHNGAADGHTPGLTTFYSMFDSVHSRLVQGKYSPVPNDVFINMGENSGPIGDEAPKLLVALRSACGPKTNLFVIVPFSGRARTALAGGYAAYRTLAPSDSHTYFIDLGDNPFLESRGSTMYSVDGQHPLSALHAKLAAQIVQARSMLIHRSSHR